MLLLHGKGGKDGTIGLNGKDGTNGKNGTNRVDIQVEKGVDGVDGQNGAEWHHLVLCMKMVKVINNCCNYGRWLEI